MLGEQIAVAAGFPTEKSARLLRKDRFHHKSLQLYTSLVASGVLFLVFSFCADTSKDADVTNARPRGIGVDESLFFLSSSDFKTWLARQPACYQWIYDYVVLRTGESVLRSLQIMSAVSRRGCTLRILNVFHRSCGHSARGCKKWRRGNSATRATLPAAALFHDKLQKLSLLGDSHEVDGRARELLDA